MASFPRTRFPGPMFNQNFPRNNFNMNPVGNRFGMPPFQRPPNPAFRPYQPPERYMSGNFQNRPHFSNFPEPAGPSGFRGRLPSNNQVFPMNPAHSFQRPRAPFERTFRPWNQMPPPIGGARPQLQNRHRPPMPSHHQGDLPLQPNKKGKMRIREFRKFKEDTTLKPFSCDTCDRAFVTENELNDHFSQHMKCDNANCTFEAHPKIVSLHKKMQHDTGYADKISKLKDDAEIQKWREERRRRFPTAENIMKRKAEQAEREARGEVLETKEFGKFKRRKGNDGDSVNKNFRRRRGRSHKKSADRRRQFHPRSQPFTINVNSDSDSDSDSHIKLNRFLGISLTNSAKEITDKPEALEVSSSPLSSITLISDKHQSPPESWCEQNLPKSKFVDDISDPNLVCADSNSSNLDKNETTFILNDDNLNDPVNKSTWEIPMDKTELKKQKNVELVEIKDPVNESICEIPTDESELKIQRDVELVEIKDSDDEDPIAISIVKFVENCMDDQDTKHGQNSDDEGPIATPIVKTVENCMDDQDTKHGQNSDDEGPVDIPIVKTVENCVDGQDAKHDSQEKLHSSGITSTQEYNTSNSEKQLTRNNVKYNRHQRNHQSHANYQDVAQEVHKSSLLEKLLADDIRHERNVILQCIRHIVKRKFFGIKNKSLK